MEKSLFRSNGLFYKANLHTHTTVSDGNLSPEEAKNAYLEKGYSIVAFSDHEVMVPHNEFSDNHFLALTSFECEFKEFFNREIPKSCKKVYHLVMIASDPNETYYPWANEDVPWGNAKNYVQDYYKGHHCRIPETEYVNQAIKDAKEHGFIVTYCHPAWSLNRFPDYSEIEGADYVEVNNSECVQMGRSGDFAEHVFDDFLWLGKPCGPTCSDDSHSLKAVGHGATYIKADSLSYEDVIRSLKQKDCFASTGPRFRDITFDPETCIVHVTSEPVEVISITTNVRTALHAGILGQEIVSEASFNLTAFVEDMKKYGLFDQAYFRVNLFGIGGTRAFSRGYFLKDLF